MRAPCGFHHRLRIPASPWAHHWLSPAIAPLAFAFDQLPRRVSFCIFRSALAASAGFHPHLPLPAEPSPHSQAFTHVCRYRPCPGTTSGLHRLLYLQACIQPTSDPLRRLNLPASPSLNGQLALTAASPAPPWINSQLSSDIASSGLALNQPPACADYCIFLLCLGPTSNSYRRSCLCALPSMNQQLSLMAASPVRL